MRPDLKPTQGPIRKGPPLRPTQGFESFPIVNGVSPSAASAVGGTSVTITGSRFTSQVTVFFGDEPALNVIVVSSGVITCDAPAHDGGTVDVTVVNFNGEQGTREQAFTFTDGYITGVSMNRGSVIGGTELSIYGVNFITGSQVFFGGVLATSIVFVDDTMYRAVTPAHVTGIVDITIVEPSGYTITGKGLFSYTSAVFGGDIRRAPSVTVREATNGGSNTASYSIDGSGTPPVGLERTTFKDDEDNTLFSGQVTGFSQSYEDDRHNYVWGTTCTDHSFRFNRYRPFGIFNQVSGTDVAKSLIAAYAPGFSTSFIQARLPRVSMALDGSEDMLTVFANMASQMGNGHFYIDYDRNVHLYLAAFEEPSLPPVTLPGYGAAAMNVAVSSTSALGTALSQGYWYFFSAFRYGTATTFTTPHPSIPIPPSPGYVQLSDQAQALNMTGTVSNGSYGTGFSRGWVMYDGSGNRIGEGWSGHQPVPVAGDVSFATQDVATVLEKLAGGGLFESKLSALAGPIYLDGSLLPTFSSIPVGPAVGGRNPTARAIYAIRIGDASGVGGTSLIEYAVISDNATTTATPVPAIKPSTINRSLPAPVAPLDEVTATESTTSVDGTGATYPERWAQTGYWAFRVTGVYQDGTESRGTEATGQILFSGTKKATLVNIPVFPAIGTLTCVFRKIYGSIFIPAPTAGVPDFERTNTRMVALILNNTVNTATFAFGTSLVGGERSASNVPPGIEDEVGPDLEEAIAPDPIDDDNDSMIKNPPVTLTLDWSQLRNRVFVRGKGTIMALDAAVGATTLTVADTQWFTPTGGKLALGHRVLEYSSVVNTSQLKLSSPLTQAVLQSDWLFGGGTPVRPFLQMDDVESQKLCSLIEIDDDGLPTDGVHEFMVTDDNLLTFSQMAQAGLKELKGAWPVRTVTYATRDPKSHRGVSVHWDLSHPPIFGDFVISDVTIDQYYDESNDLQPRYNVTATSSSRFTFNDFLRYLDDKSQTPGGAFQTPNVYSSLNVVGGFMYHETMAIRTTSDTAFDELVLNGSALQLGGTVGKISHGYMWGLSSVDVGTSAVAGAAATNVFAAPLELLPQIRTIVLTPATSENLNNTGAEGGFDFGIIPAGGVTQNSFAGVSSGVWLCIRRNPPFGAGSSASNPQQWSVIVVTKNGGFSGGAVQGNVINDVVMDVQADTVYDCQINFLNATTFTVVINDFTKTYSFPDATFPASTYFRLGSRVLNSGVSGLNGIYCRYAKMSSSLLA